MLNVKSYFTVRLSEAIITVKYDSASVARQFLLTVCKLCVGFFYILHLPHLYLVLIVANDTDKIVMRARVFVCAYVLNCQTFNKIIWIF